MFVGAHFGYYNFGEVLYSKFKNNKTMDIVKEMIDKFVQTLGLVRG
jgi:hypothetical protein